MRILAALLLIFSAIAPVAAQDAPSPELAQAIDDWLADDDAASLPVMARLAQGGDKAAQMLISQIDRETPSGGETPYVLAMDRKTRIATFRAPGGLSGTPWVKAMAKDGDALAAALLAAKLPDAGIDTAFALHKAGEVEAAKRLTWEIIARGRFDAVMSMGPDQPLLKDLPYVAWLQGWFGQGVRDQIGWTLKSPGEGRASGLIFVSLVAPVMAPQFGPNAELRPILRALQGVAGDVQAAGVEAVDRAADLIVGAAAKDPALRPAAAMCDRLCGAETGRCMLSTMALLGGYDRLQFQDTPYEALIPQSAYVRSKRAEMTLERRVREATKRFSSASGYGVSQCLAAEVAG